MRKTLPECALLVKAVKTAYPGIPQFQRDVVLQAREDGYVSTVYGYIRRLDYINSSNNFTRGCDERRASNTPIQGSAADIMKRAQSAVYDKTGEDSREYFKRIDDGKIVSEAMEGLLLVHGHTDMILQVHDEMVFEIDDNAKFIREAATWIKAEMERKPVDDFPVPVIAEASLGYDWGHKIDFDKWVKNLEGIK